MTRQRRYQSGDYVAAHFTDASGYSVYHAAKVEAVADDGAVTLAFDDPALAHCAAGWRPDEGDQLLLIAPVQR